MIRPHSVVTGTEAEARPVGRCAADMTDDLPQPAQVLQLIEVEYAIPLAQRVYCPHKDCSAMIMKSAAVCPGRATSQCPQCKRGFCLDCMFPNGHQASRCCEKGLVVRYPFC